MGSKTFDGVWFICFPNDHAPSHVHGNYSGTELIIDVFPNGEIRESERHDAVTPKNAKRSEVAKILRVAADHGPELWLLWETMHGK